MKLSHKMSKLFIYAPNVHQGGGAVLLTELLRINKCDVMAILDERMVLPPEYLGDVTFQRVKHTLFGRMTAEIDLRRGVSPQDVVLCFGNLPPLFKLRGVTFVFLQNRYLVDQFSFVRTLPLRAGLRITLERLWLYCRRGNASQYFVQTASMQQLTIERLQVNVKRVAFVAKSPQNYNLNQKDKSNNQFDFIYVASGEPHKNHLKLLEAWKFLAQEGIFPSLCLTLDKAKSIAICSYLENLSRRYCLKVENVGVLEHKDVLALYKKSGAIIYPSKFESLGLPLIEARQLGLPVLASELDYVRDVLDPDQAFNPDSSRSIARAVKRFMGIGEESLPLVDSKDFINELLSEGPP